MTSTFFNTTRAFSCDLYKMTHESLFSNNQQHRKLTFGVLRISLRRFAGKIRTKHILKVDSHTFLCTLHHLVIDVSFILPIPIKLTHEPHLENP